MKNNENKSTGHYKHLKRFKKKKKKKKEEEEYLVPCGKDKKKNPFMWCSVFTRIAKTDH